MDLLATVDLLDVPPAPKFIDILGEEERKKNPPHTCICEHGLMLHARKIKGIYTHQQGPCMLIVNGVKCECKEAVPKEG